MEMKTFTFEDAQEFMLEFLEMQKNFVREEPVIYVSYETYELLKKLSK
jgi:hypothetical protein